MTHMESVHIVEGLILTFLLSHLVLSDKISNVWSTTNFKRWGTRQGNGVTQHERNFHFFSKALKVSSPQSDNADGRDILKFFDSDRETSESQKEKLQKHKFLGHHGNQAPTTMLNETIGKQTNIKSSFVEDRTFNKNIHSMNSNVNYPTPDIWAKFWKESKDSTLFSVSTKYPNFRMKRDAESSIMAYVIAENPEFLEFVTKIHKEFCPNIQTCTPVGPNITGEINQCCKNCSCNEDCFEYYSCCPDVQEVDISRPREKETFCLEASFFSWSQSYDCGEIIRPYTCRMVATCSRRGNDSLIELCEKTNVSEKYEIMSKIPVSSDDGRTVYKNVFCALCNSEVNTVSWPTELVCVNEKVFYVDTMSEFLKELRDREIFCNLLSHPPNETKFQVNLIPCKHGMVETCNVTGKWLHYDSLELEVCHSYDAPYFYDTKWYKNVLCYLCNVDNIDDRTCYTNNTGSDMYCDFINGDDKTSVFSILLDFNDYEKMMLAGTDEKKFYDRRMRSYRNIGCIAPLQYINSRCTTTYSTFEEIHVDIYYRVSMENVFPNCSQCCSTKMKIIMNEIANFIDMRIGNNWKRTIVSYEVIFTNQKTTINKVSAIIFHYEFLQTDSSYQDTVKMFLDVNKIKHLVWNEHYDAVIEVDGRDYTGTELQRHIFSCLKYGNDYKESMLPFKRISDLLLCPHVNVTFKDWSWNLTQNEEKLCFLDIILCLKSYEFMIMNDSLMLCKSRYDEMIELYFNAMEKLNSGFNIERILSILCMSLSIVGLILTLMTYSMFEALRNLPGYNIMALCLSSLLAFCCTVIGQWKMEAGTGCAVVGLLIHFFWLCTFGWLNVCCIHMFRMFRSSFVPNETKSLCCFALYCLYTFILSTAFVGINVIRQLLATNMVDFGYSDERCYISRGENVIYTVGVPLGTIIVVNILLFVLVVLKIKKSPNVRNSMKHKRRNMLIFVKLSTLTGMSWIFGFIYQFTGVVVFRYLFTITGALQGLFIFLSFVINLRVLNMYKFQFFGRSRTSNETRLTCEIQTIGTNSR